MDASPLLIVSAAAFLGACATTFQPGLANATALGGMSAETRVHDVVADGRDACERSAFPQGGVLRGQLPPCTPREAYQRLVEVMPPPLAPPSGVTLPRSYRAGFCPVPRRRPVLGAQLDGFWLSPPLGFVCDPFW